MAREASRDLADVERPLSRTQRRGRLDLGQPVGQGAEGVDRRLAAFERIAPLRGERALDVGCGNGAYTRLLARRFGHVIAIDVEPRRLEEARHVIRDEDGLGNVDILRMDVERLSFADASFDAVTAIEVLEHVAGVDGALAQIARVLRPGGLLYVSVPNQLFPLETHLVSLPRGRAIPGRYLPFLPWLPPLHRRLSHARNFTPARLRRAAARAALAEVGVDWVMPPFDRWSFGRRFVRPMTDILQGSPFRVLGVSIVAVYRRMPPIAPADSTQ